MNNQDSPRAVVFGALKQAGGERQEPELEQLFTEKDLAAAGIASRSKLRKDRMVGTGIPFLYVGTRVRYRASDVQAYLVANSATRASQRPEGDVRNVAQKARAARNAAQA